MNLKKKFSSFVNHLIEKGFFFNSSEIYGGLSNTWDYGPYGVELKRLVKNLWWDYFITIEPNVVGLDSAILLKPEVLKASGHLKNFVDYKIDCRKCQKRYRVNHFFEFKNFKLPEADYKDSIKVKKNLKKYNLRCLNCGAQDFTDVSPLNLLFETKIGVKETSKNKVFLRPETAQGIFLNLKRIQRTLNLKFPFGIGQIGKSFRNEITLGPFLFRTFEFEQLEIEFFFLNPEDNAHYFNHYTTKISNFIAMVGISHSSWSIRVHDNKELAHYSKKTIDFEYHFPFGKKELCGISDRGNFDLLQHSKSSHVALEYLNDQNEKVIPFAIEPSLGVDRLILAILWEAFTIEAIDNDNQRLHLKLPLFLCPVQIAFLPLVKKLKPVAERLYKKFHVKYRTLFLTNSSIGKRYRYNDSIGTYFCVTVDYDTLKDQKVTIRNRNTMKQERIEINDLNNFFLENLQFKFKKIKK